MGYLHIDNLYKDRDILLFRECYALEKIHGTSAHLKYHAAEKRITYSAGAASTTNFQKLFDEEFLLSKFAEVGVDVLIFGEAYGGAMQGMKDVYGDKMKFVAFDVQINELWLAVPQAAEFVQDLGLEFVFYEKVSTDLEALDKARHRPSEQAIRNGIGPGKETEGVILRPLIELKKNDGGRVICKYKREKFRETKAPREIDQEKLKVLNDAAEVAEEWVTHMRFNHVHDKLKLPLDMGNTLSFINAMIEDVKREGAGEITWSKEVEHAVGKKTASLLREAVKASLV